MFSMFRYRLELKQPRMVNLPLLLMLLNIGSALATYVIRPFDGLVYI